VPAFFVLDKRDPGAFIGLGEHHQRLVAQADRRKHFDDFINVVPVDFLCAPAEGFEPLFVNVQVVAESGGLALAEPIDVDDGHQVVQLIDSGQGSGLPHSAFGAFAVPEQDIGAVIQVVQSGA
jgi:hypothetical protein